MLFVEAIIIDAMRYPENLYNSSDVWDDEWNDLLNGIDIRE
jgi:hypothetical protein